VTSTYDKPEISIGNGYLKQSTTILPLQTLQIPIMVNATFDENNHLGFVWKMCSDENFTHDIVMKFNVMMTISYFGRSEQNSIQTYHYVDCSANVSRRKS